MTNSRFVIHRIKIIEYINDTHSYSWVNLNSKKYILGLRSLQISSQIKVGVIGYAQGSKKL